MAKEYLIYRRRRRRQDNSTFEKLVATTDPELLDTQGYTWISGVGMWEFRPKNFNPENEYPTLIALHGAGQVGDGGDEDLELLVDPEGEGGMASVIYMNKSILAAMASGMVIIMPQAGESFWSWPLNVVTPIINACRNRSYVDNNRLYMTGFSSGGYGVHNILGSETYSQYIAAAVVVSSRWLSVQEDSMPNALNIPIWYFHGTDDATTQSYSVIKSNVEAFNALGPAIPARLTGFVDKIHNREVWDAVYDFTGRDLEQMDEQDYEVPFDQNIFSWLLQYTLDQQATRLTTPGSFTVTPGEEKNTISWNAVDNAEEYVLEFHDGDENWGTVPNYNGTSISGIEHTGLTNGTEYFYRVKATAEGYTDSEFATSSGTPAASGPIWEARIHLNGNNQGSAPDYYNGTAIGGEAADPDDTVIADILDVNQDPTGVNMVVVNPAWQIGTSSAHTSIGNFPYPGEVVQQHSAENSFMNQGPAEFYFGNLPEGTYRVTCYGYFNYTEPVLTEFEVNGNSQTLDCNDNVDDTVVFNNVEPDENDRINIRFGKPEGYGLTFSTANLIILERLT